MEPDEGPPARAAPSHSSHSIIRKRRAEFQVVWSSEDTTQLQFRLRDLCEYLSFGPTGSPLGHR